MSFPTKWIALPAVLISLSNISNVYANTFEYDRKNLLTGDSHTLNWDMPSYEKCLNVSGINLGTKGSWTVQRNNAGLGSSSIFCYEHGSSTSTKYTAKYTVFDKENLIASVINRSNGEDDNPSSWPQDAHQVTGYVDSEPGIGILYAFDDSFPDKIGSVKAGYNSSMWVDGLIDLYEATGKLHYAQIAIDTAYKHLELGVNLHTAKDTNEKNYLDWYSPGTNYLDHWHYEWRAAQGLARVLAALHDDLNFANNSKLSEIKSFLIDDFVPKWESRIAIEEVTHMLSRAGLVYLYLHDVTQNRDYRKKAGWLATKLYSTMSNTKKSIEVNGEDITYYNITCYLDPTRGCASNTLLAYGSIDVSHAGDTVQFIHESVKRGIIFNQSDIDLLVNTLKYSILGQRAAENNTVEYYFRSNVHTVTNVDFNEEYLEKGKYQGYWAKLAKYDRDLLFMYLKWYEIDISHNIEESFGMPNVSHRLSGNPWSVQILANLALAIKESQNN